jgi:alcohol dehydrogenase class IV
VNGEPHAAPFRWQDGERLVLFGRGTLARAPELLDPGYVLLTTPRAAAAAPDLPAGADAVHEVAAGRVDELAGALRGRVEGELVVALGGGRVIDVAKALAAADPPRRVAAIPTTLSGAEMTSVHRHASGVAAETPRVRPAIVINDPALSASQPPDELAQSAANALGHAVEGPLTPLRNPVAELAALDAARLIRDGLADPDPGERARDALALAALLAGYTIGSTGYGLHHVVSQTLARFAGVGHGAANAIMLPQSLGALAERSPEWNALLGEALGSEPSAFATRLRDLTGVSRLRDAGVSEGQLEHCAEQAAQRPELHMTPPPASAEELRALYQAAY